MAPKIKGSKITTEQIKDTGIIHKSMKKLQKLEKSFMKLIRSGNITTSVLKRLSNIQKTMIGLKKRISKKARFNLTGVRKLLKMKLY